MHKNVYTGSPWEKKVAYCRAKRCDQFVYVSGTVAVGPDGNVVGPANMYEQASFIFRKIGSALTECGASLKDVVRTRMFVTDVSLFEDVARAHREVFEGVDPVTTCVEVSRLVAPEFLIEIEVDAMVNR
jgi:enamine deaminase RidA (YjgF/YER057c/UK114 family)